MTQITDDQLNAFTAAVDAKILAYQTENYPDLVHMLKPVTVERGQKYARIVVHGGGQRSVFCFVDLSNGDILKAAGWKAPAKHARGNIANGAKDVGPYGPAYLR